LDREIFVVGHINPDTDSICSAIAYANLKQQINKQKYVAKRAGSINSETSFVLNYFNVKEPEYLGSVHTQVKDMEIRRLKGINKNISLKEAWTIMQKENIITLSVVNNRNNLEGLITVDDIVKSHMDMYDSRLLGSSRTSIQNIVDTLEGNLLTGSLKERLKGGKVLIAAANPDLMEHYIEEGDVVIVGNRYESQLSAIEMKAKCIVVTYGATVTKTIKSIAGKAGCTIISTPYDTFTVARLINQSMPVSFFMRRKDLITFDLNDELNEIRSIMAKVRHRYFPVLDEEGHYCGLISRRNLLGAKMKQVILVDHNEKTQAVDGLEEAEILEIIDHHRIGTLETINPIFFRNQPLGCTSTIIYLMYKEYGVEIDKQMAGLLCSAILSDTLIFKSPTCTSIDREAAKEMAEIAEINIEEYARKMFAAGSDLKSKTPEEIFHQDFKTFTLGDVKLAVGQINSMDKEELDIIREKLIPYMDQKIKEYGVDMIFFMLTDILESSSELLCQGKGARKLVIDAFSLEKNEDKIYLEGVVSRKKQLIPSLMREIQREE
jgi:manganese-dependent inorganic pyrophosphatase